MDIPNRPAGDDQSPQANPVARPLVPAKASFESNADVQRWLKQQAMAEGGKPPFDPRFLEHHRDRPWVLSSLAHFYEDDLITDVVGTAKSGKEANVYCCIAHARVGLPYLAAKVYRPRMFRSLSNDAVYRQSRSQHDERGQTVRDPHRRRGGQRGRQDQVTAWIAYEFAMQRTLAEAGVAVPQPFAQVGNALLMAYIGGRDEPAPRLREVDLDPADAPALFADVMRNIALALAHHCIHGDLSAYNLLFWDGQIILIDFAQAVDPRYNPDVYPLLERDIARVCQHFARYGVAADAPTLAADLWSRYSWGELG